MAETFYPGNYRASIQNVTIGKTSNGNPQIAYKILPTALIDDNGEDADCPEAERTIYRVITDKTINYIMDDLKELGYDRDTFDELDSSHPNAFDLEGKEVMVKMEMDSYQGKEKERWGFAWSGGGKVEPLQRNEMSALNAQFGKRLKGLNKGGSTTAARPATAVHAGNSKPGNDSDIPF